MDLAIKSALNRGGFTVTDISRLKGGRTNRLYKLKTDDGQFVVKQYLSDVHHRLQREFDALEYLHTKGFRNVPKALYKNTPYNFAVYSLEPGTSLSYKDEQIEGLTTQILDQMVQFLVALHDIPPSKENSHLMNAMLMNSSVQDYAATILENCKLARNEDPENSAFVMHEVSEILAGAVPLMLQKLDRSAWRLSPVDFGTHNILVSGHKSVFIDFEEFGWDDPMQAVAYPVPAMQPKHQSYFIESYLKASPLAASITDRLPLILQLRYLDWISRLLIGLTRSSIEKRQFATGEEFDQHIYITKQKGRIAAQLERYRKLER